MSDDYPQVVEDLSLPVTYRVWSEADPKIGGRWKVVPADAIVIERSELPEVTGYSMQSPNTGRVTFADGLRRVEVNDDFRRLALAFLAAEIYVEARPPVDEAQVDSVFRLINERTSRTAEENRELARHLVRNGVRIPKEQP